MTFSQWIDCLIVPLCAGVCALLLSRRCLHFFQLESYQFRGYFRALSRQKEKAFLRFFILGGVIAVLHLLSGRSRLAPRRPRPHADPGRCLQVQGGL